MKLSLYIAAQFGQGLSSLPDVRLPNEVVLKMSKNLIRINEAFPDVQAEEARMFKEAGCPQENDPKFKELIEQKIRFQKETKIEVELLMIDYRDLKIGQGTNDNHIPPHAVAALAPMISDFQEGQ